MTKSLPYTLTITYKFVISLDTSLTQTDSPDIYKLCQALPSLQLWPYSLLSRILATYKLSYGFSSHYPSVVTILY